MTDKKHIERLHFITQRKDKSHTHYARLACMGGCRWIQLRMKDMSSEEMMEEAIQTKIICEEYNAILIINDYVDIALKVQADGVHLGKHDMSLPEARKMLGSNYIIGGTANSFDDIALLKIQGADYVGLGPYRFTVTKKNLSPVISYDGLNGIMTKLKNEKIDIPVIAIGGINRFDIPGIFKTGIFGIAVSSGITDYDDITACTIEFIKDINTSI